MSNIVIVGFMGTGKTAVAKRLSGATGREYVSTDAMIEEKEKMSITDIFEKKGEEYFRRAEKEAVKSAGSRDNLIIDAGGGVVISEDNVAELKNNGIIICLWADAEVIYERTRRYSHRPLLNVKDPLVKIKELLEKRRKFYERADFHVNTSRLTLGEVVEAVKDIADKEAEKEEAGI